MSMAFVLTLPLELAIGSIAGFYFSDKRKKNAAIDIVLALIAYSLISWYVFWTYPELNIATWLQLAICWVALSAGVVIGAKMRLRIIHKLTADCIQKQDIQNTLDGFIRQANRVVYDYHVRSVDEMDTRFKRVIESLSHLRTHADHIDEPGIIQQLNAIEDSCRALFRLSYKIKMTAQEDNANINRYKDLSYQLRDVMWQTLNRIEARTYVRLKTHAGKTVVMMMKARR